MNFIQWLTTFISEKEIDLEGSFEVQGPSGTNYMHYENVIDAIKSAGAKEQRDFKNVVCRIDFQNGDVKEFLRHIAQGIAV